jgi:hypothetical protein
LLAQDHHLSRELLNNGWTLFWLPVVQNMLKNFEMKFIKKPNEYKIGEVIRIIWEQHKVPMFKNLNAYNIKFHCSNRNEGYNWKQLLCSLCGNSSQSIFKNSQQLHRQNVPHLRCSFLIQTNDQSYMSNTVKTTKYHWQNCFNCDVILKSYMNISFKIHATQHWFRNRMSHNTDLWSEKNKYFQEMGQNYQYTWLHSSVIEIPDQVAQTVF